MKIELREISIQDVVGYSKHLKECQGYIDKDEEGIYGMNGQQKIGGNYHGKNNHNYG